MFGKLRIKLTLFNLAVFGGILVIFTMIIFLGGDHKKENTDIQKMYLMASDKIIFEDSHSEDENKNNKHKVFNNHLENNKDIFCIKLDKNIEEENYNIVQNDVAEIFLSEVLKTNQYTGEITYENRKYKFLKVIL